MTCPITSVCYQIIHAKTFGSARAQLWAYEQDRWDTLGLRLLSDHKHTNTTKRLRAFYVIELFHKRLVPSFIGPPSSLDIGQQFLQAKIAHDHAGLTDLISLCSEAERSLVLTEGEEQLEGRLNLYQRSELSNRFVQLLVMCRSAATTLRSMLRGSTANMPSIGANLAQAFLLVHPHALGIAIKHLNNLLDINIHNPVRACPTIVPTSSSSTSSPAARKGDSRA